MVQKIFDMLTSDTTTSTRTICRNASNRPVKSPTAPTMLPLSSLSPLRVCTHTSEEY
uniref:Uncharacterized protein n=1 Tax=Mesocestoides corti TaxID=53468 RepID=A0A5K3G0K9_MESCO